MAIRGLKLVQDTVNTRKWVLVVEKLEKMCCGALKCDICALVMARSAQGHKICKYTQIRAQRCNAEQVNLTQSK